MKVKFVQFNMLVKTIFHISGDIRPVHAICNGVARIVCGMEGAPSRVDENAKYNVDLMSDQVDVDKRRLQCVLVFILVSRSEF